MRKVWLAFVLTALSTFTCRAADSDLLVEVHDGKTVTTGKLLASAEHTWYWYAACTSVRFAAGVLRKIPTAPFSMSVIRFSDLTANLTLLVG